MPYKGNCICQSIQVTLTQQPLNSLRCHCRNCARSGGGSSVNYTVDDSDVTIHDPESAAKGFEDNRTVSGNRVLRQFCGNCGSPVLTKSPQFPGKSLVKASLFDSISRPGMEVFTDRRQVWLQAIEGAEQA